MVRGRCQTFFDKTTTTDHFFNVSLTYTELLPFFAFLSQLTNGKKVSLHSFKSLTISREFAAIAPYQCWQLHSALNQRSDIFFICSVVFLTFLFKLMTTSAAFTANHYTNIYRNLNMRKLPAFLVIYTLSFLSFVRQQVLCRFSRVCRCKISL